MQGRRHRCPATRSLQEGPSLPRRARVYSNAVVPVHALSRDHACSAFHANQIVCMFAQDAAPGSKLINVRDVALEHWAKYGRNFFR